MRERKTKYSIQKMRRYEKLTRKFYVVSKELLIENNEVTGESKQEKCHRERSVSKNILS